MSWLTRFTMTGAKLRHTNRVLSQIRTLLPGVSYRIALEPEFRLTHIGDGIFDLLGFKPKELLNENRLSYLRLIHPEHEEIVLQKKNLCRQGREEKNLQYHLLTKSRSVKRVEDHFVGEYSSSGDLIAINGYIREHRRSSAKLQLLNQLDAYRAAIDVNIISSVTDVFGTIIYANENFKRVSGYTDEELLGKTHRIVRSGHHPKSFFDELWRTISVGKMWRGEILNRAKDGSVYWVDTVIIPVFDENHKITNYLSLRMLVTERKRAEEQKDKYIKVLEEIAHVVAHDLRGPVCTILGLVNLVGKTGSPPEDCPQTTERLIETVRKLDQITRELSTRIYSADRDIKEGRSNS